MAFRKNCYNEVIAQFFATLFVEEHGDSRKLHWMTGGNSLRCLLHSLLDSLVLGEMMPTA
jgi:hypothetical protein